jgi:hypothetical protein
MNAARKIEINTVPIGRKRPRRPVLVCVDGKIVGDAVVVVSPRDPNWHRNLICWPRGFDGEIRVAMDRPLLAEIVRRMPRRI